MKTFAEFLFPNTDLIQLEVLRIHKTKNFTKLDILSYSDTRAASFQLQTFFIFPGFLRSLGDVSTLFENSVYITNPSWVFSQNLSRHCRYLKMLSWFSKEVPFHCSQRVNMLKNFIRLFRIWSNIVKCQQLLCYFYEKVWPWQRKVQVVGAYLFSLCWSWQLAMDCGIKAQEILTEDTLEVV